MLEPGWNPWKIATIGILTVFATALVTGVTVAHYMGATNTQTPEAQQFASTTNPPSKATDNALPAVPLAVPPAITPPAAAPPAPVAQVPAAPAPAPPRRYVAARPSAADIEECNRYAASPHDRTADTVKDALMGGAAGAGLGAAGGAIAAGGHGAGKGAGIGGLLGVAAGTLYGLNEANQRDSQMAAAYRACMRRRGYND